jgi:hypothetical protein
MQLYRGDNQDVLPINLEAIRYRVPDDSDLQSVRDRRPDPRRISFDYAGEYAFKGRLDADLEFLSRQPRFGILANLYAGPLTDKTFEGPIQRVNAFGSVFLVHGRGNRNRADDVFVRYSK